MSAAAIVAMVVMGLLAFVVPAMLMRRARTRKARSSVRVVLDVKGLERIEAAMEKVNSELVHLGEAIDEDPPPQATIDGAKYTMSIQERPGGHTLSVRDEDGVALVEDLPISPPPQASVSASSWKRPPSPKPDVLGLEGDARMRAFESAIGDARSRSHLPLHALALLLLAVTACGPSIIIIEDGDTPSDLPNGDGDTGDTDTPPDMGDGDIPDLPGDCEPGELGCECAQEDLDGDGEVPPEGECYFGLECNMVTGVCDEACIEADPAIDCDGTNLCWAWLPSWSAWAQYAEPGVFDELVQADIIQGAECFEVQGSDAHVCIIDVECVDLVGRPAAELVTVESACADQGPWESVVQTNTQCFGIVGAVAILLDPNHG